jgi:hypothetical protein
MSLAELIQSPNRNFTQRLVAWGRDPTTPVHQPGQPWPWSGPAATMIEHSSGVHGATRWGVAALSGDVGGQWWRRQVRWGAVGGTATAIPVDRGGGATGNNKTVWQERCLSHEWLAGEWLRGDKHRRGGCGQ